MLVTSMALRDVIARNYLQLINTLIDILMSKFHTKKGEGKPMTDKRKLDGAVEKLDGAVDES